MTESNKNIKEEIVIKPLKQDSDEKIRRKAMFGTFGFYLLILLLFLITGLRKPYPPYEPKGIDIVLGTDLTGFDETVDTDEAGFDEFDEDPDYTEDSRTDQSTEETAETSPEVTEDDIVAHDIRDAPEVGTEDPTDKTLDDHKEDVADDERTESEVGDEERERSVDPRTLFSRSENRPQGDTQEDGEQGAEDGREDLASFDRRGTATEDGSGMSEWDLPGRTIERRPEIDDDSQKQGRVLVEIVVDRNGNVVHARAGVRDTQNPGRTTTTFDAELLEKARQAALSTKFNADPSAPNDQKGSMLFTFILQ